MVGGEALLYKKIDDLLKIAHEHGIQNKLITNGLILAQHKKSSKIFLNLDAITLSLDSINEETNEDLGRGEHHFRNIKKVLEELKKRKIEVNINTVVNKKNKKEIQALGQFLNNYQINKWKLFKFVPLRETAEKNKTEFEITEKEFLEVKESLNQFENIKQIEFRQEKDMEEKYTLIISNGDIIKTENQKDVKKGNVKYHNPIDFI